MSNLTHDELARLRLKAKHGTLTPEEQQAYDDYVTEQLSAVPSPPSGAVPPKKGFKWESEKVAEWRLKARHDGLDENERFILICSSCCLSLSKCRNLSWFPTAKPLPILQTHAIMGALDL